MSQSIGYSAAGNHWLRKKPAAQAAQPPAAVKLPLGLPHRSSGVRLAQVLS
ncbi:MAG: hypothetical protein HIU89_03865 [Proteobacteria bacterium]|nr:hypothetical protein [Pseudomonadota bacterium]